MNMNDKVQPYCSMVLSRTEQTQQVLSTEDEDARIASMRAMGAKNLEPPLPRSSHLLLRKSGHVIPYDPMFAAQRDLVANCDAAGNTDPAAWLPTVVEEEFDPVAYQSGLMAAQAEVLSQALTVTAKHRMPDAVDLAPRPMDMPNGAIPLKDMTYDKLRSGLDALARRLG